MKVRVSIPQDHVWPSRREETRLEPPRFPFQKSLKFETKANKGLYLTYHGGWVRWKSVRIWEKKFLALRQATDRVSGGLSGQSHLGKRQNRAAM